LTKRTLEANDSLVEPAVEADRVVERAVLGRVEDPVLRRDRVVVLAKGRRDVDQAGAVLGGDEVAGEHREAPRLAVAEGEYRAPVSTADQLRARQPGDDLGALASTRSTSASARISTSSRPRLHVGDVRRDGDGDVAGQRPGRRRQTSSDSSSHPATESARI
jgi:hypothetical protein